jgi:hypothetical protein
MKTMISSILEVAQRAAVQSFVSYTPADYSYESVKAHECANIIEYDPCWIPVQTYQMSDFSWCNEYGIIIFTRCISFVPRIAIMQTAAL